MGAVRQPLWGWYSRRFVEIHADNSGSDIAFGHGSSGAFTETMRIKGSGSVGIGTNSPGAQLEVRKDGNISSNWLNAQLRIDGATDPRMTLSLGYDTTNNFGVIQAGQNTVAFKDLLLNPFGGNVGIGTTGPTAKLDVVGSDEPLATGIRGTGGFGVVGTSNAGAGVVGTSTTGYGVAGSNGGSNTTGYAGYFTGRVAITGNLEANNLPGATFGQVDCGGSCAYVPAHAAFTIDTVTLNAPAPGVIVSLHMPT